MLVWIIGIWYTVYNPISILDICKIKDVFLFSAQPGPSRLAPPTPTTEDSTPLIPTDHTRSIAPSYTSMATIQQTQQVCYCCINNDYTF